MSEYKRYTGKVKKVDIAPREVEAFLVSKLSIADLLNYESFIDNGNEFDNNYEFLDWYDSIGDKYFIVKGYLYEYLEQNRQDECSNFYEAKQNEDGTIDFHVHYYDGGCCLSEAVEEAIEGME